MPDKATRIIFPIAAIAAFLLIWQLAAGMYPPDQFPGPRQVLFGIMELHAGGKLLPSIGISLFRFGIAYVSSLLLAVPAGLLLGSFRSLRQALNPIVQILRPISPIAWFPLAVLWFGIGNAPAIFIIFVSAFFPILLATVSAVLSIPESYYKVTRNFGARPLQVFLSVVIPAAFPGIMTGLHIALGTAWIHLVAGEMLGADSGLGFLIIDARNFLRTDLILAGMVLIGVTGLLLNSLITVAERAINRQWGRVGEAA